MPLSLEQWIASELGQYVQSYIEYGFAVFPCHGVSEALRCTCGKQPCGENNKQAGKHPFTRNGVKDSSKDISVVAKMFAYRTDLNVAVATGKQSGAFVVDTDNRGDESGEDSLRDLQDEHGALPQTLMSVTGSGFHRFYRQPEGFDVRNATELAKRIDIRGTGGYVIVAPSRHYSGNMYSFDGGCSEIAEASTWLLDMLRPKSKPVRELSHDYASGATPDWSKDDVLRMLGHISPDISYQEWVEVGMSLHNGGYTLSVWDNWSRAGQKYENKCCEVRWRGFGKQDGITMGTLVNMAQLNGWQPASIVREYVDTSIADAFAEKAVKKAVGLIEEKKEPITPQTVFDPLKIDGLIGDTVRWVCSDAMFPQPKLALIHTLAFAGAVMGRRYASPVNTRTNIYFAGVANTTAGKNHSRVKLPLLAEAAGLSEFNGAHGVISDTGVARSLIDNPSQLLMLDEWGLVLQSIGDAKAPSHSKKIKTLFMALYSQSGSNYKHGDYANKKLNESIVIENPNLCVYGTTTEREYIKALSKDAVESGELNRVIAIKADDVMPKRIDVAIKPSQDLIDRWERFSQGAYSLATNGSVAIEPKVVGWGDCDDLRWNMLLEQHSMVNNGTPSAALWGRMYENSIKIAMIFAIARNKEMPEMCKRDFEIARHIVDESIEYMTGLIGDKLPETDHEAAIIEVLAYVQKAGKGGITKTLLYKKFRKYKARELNDMLSSLIEQGAIESVREDGGGSGRPSVRYVAK